MCLVAADLMNSVTRFFWLCFISLFSIFRLCFDSDITCIVLKHRLYTLRLCKKKKKKKKRVVTIWFGWRERGVVGIFLNVHSNSSFSLRSGNTPLKPVFLHSGQQRGCRKRKKKTKAKKERMKDKETHKQINKLHERLGREMTTFQTRTHRGGFSLCSCRTVNEADQTNKALCACIFISVTRPTQR